MPALSRKSHRARPAAGRRTPVRCSGCGSYAGSVAFGRDESARVDDSGAEAPARRPVVPGTDVVAFVQRAGRAFGQVKRRDDGRIRRVGKERVLRTVARGEVLCPLRQRADDGRIPVGNRLQAFPSGTGVAAVRDSWCGGHSRRGGAVAGCGGMEPQGTTEGQASRRVCDGKVWRINGCAHVVCNCFFVDRIRKNRNSNRR